MKRRAPCSNRLWFASPVCRVSAIRRGGYRARATACQILPRAMEDLIVLRGAPWWNSQRLAIGLGGVALMALVGFAWVGLLRRQVARQFAVIEAKAQREAVIEERQRIAREFHDTLEQELAGLSIRLDAATPRVADEKARDLLRQQQKLCNGSRQRRGILYKTCAMPHGRMRRWTKPCTRWWNIFRPARWCRCSSKVKAGRLSACFGASITCCAYA